MTLSTDERLIGSIWVAEKADLALGSACWLADWFRENKSKLPREELADAARMLYDVIYYVAKLSAYAHGNEECWSEDWIRLMLTQGHERFEEFRQTLDRQTPNDISPSEQPQSVRETVALFDETERVLQMSAENKTQVRNRVLELSHQMTKSKFTRPTGDKIKDLLDDQAVNVTISWEEFQEKSLAIAREGHENYVKQMEEVFKPWA